uniref:Heterochromatin protein 1 n=1 Tax=Lepisosteus oculatus TaxID=7918 RepID=W5N1F7_LEPOC
MRKKQNVKQRRAEEAATAQEYVVEKIIDRRVTEGKVEYFLKWKGFPEADNTWEPEDNLDCPELIAEFQSRVGVSLEPPEQDREQPDGGEGGDANTDSVNRVPVETGYPFKFTAHFHGNRQAYEWHVCAMVDAEQQSHGQESAEPPRGFASGLEPECIIGSTDCEGELMFLLKWKGSEEVGLVPAREASVRCPEVVIAFYEERLTWHSGHEGERQS